MFLTVICTVGCFSTIRLQGQARETFVWRCPTRPTLRWTSSRGGYLQSGRFTTFHLPIWGHPRGRVESVRDPAQERYRVSVGWRVAVPGSEELTDGLPRRIVDRGPCLR